MNIKFTRSNKKRNRWNLKKNIKLVVNHPDKKVIAFTRKKIRKNREDILKLSDNERKNLLINRGILKLDTKAPSDLINIMVYNLI